MKTWSPLPSDYSSPDPLRRRTLTLYSPKRTTPTSVRSLGLLSFNLLSTVSSWMAFCNEHYAVTSLQINQNDIEIDFSERLHDMVCRYRIVVFNAELVNCFGKGLPDTWSRSTSADFMLRSVMTWTASSNMCLRQGLQHV